jgi:hypothetical protein
MSEAVYVYCAECHKAKKPLGRSAPLEMASGLCNDDCPGYRQAPEPDCRWPGEEFCGPGCMRGDR